MLDALKEKVYHLHLEPPKYHLVAWTGGNVSAMRYAKDEDPIPREAPVNDVVTWDQMNPHHYRSAPRHEDHVHDGL